MTPSLKAQLIDALESVEGNINPERGFCDEVEAEIKEALAALRAEPVSEPVAYQYQARDGSWPIRALYTHAVTPLTDAQISLMAHNEDAGDWNDLRYRDCWHKGYMAGARAIEAAHGIKPKE